MRCSVCEWDAISRLGVSLHPESCTFLQRQRDTAGPAPTSRCAPTCVNAYCRRDLAVTFVTKVGLRALSASLASRISPLTDRDA